MALPARYEAGTGIRTAAAFALVWILWGGPASVAEEVGPPASARDPGQKGRLVIEVEEGQGWLHAFRYMHLVKIKNPPQMAVWLEDIAGNYVAHLFVTRRTALQDWRATLFEKRDRIRRPSALPVWVHRHFSQLGEPAIQPKKLCAECHDKHKNRDKSTRGLPELDAITGATPKSSFRIDWPVPSALVPGFYVVRAEINHSRDFDECYRRDLPEDDPNWSGGRMGSGQPSILWEGVLEIGDRPSLVSLQAVGRGHPAGKTGEVSAGLNLLSSARRIVDSMEARYVPAP